MQSTQEVNVRVAVRVRPLLPKEKLGGESSCVKIQPKTKQLILGKDRVFTFDHVLPAKCSQDLAYDTCVDSLVKACFEGYNATVFAYGQTGSGKTFTVGGGNIANQTEEEIGIIPRAVKHMYQHIQSNQSREYTVKVSYIEIYKEELRDLLDLDTSSKDLHIREDDQGNTLIIGTSEIECETMEEVMAYLEQGSSYRHTGSTQMNEHSSRSHSIFTLLIEQRWFDVEDGSSERSHRSRKPSDGSEIIEDDGDIEHYMCAKFHFVDLAGSERAHRTGNVGDRFKESVHINSGLLALGNVISALGDVKKKATHIPYRDSKITRLLKDSLGGNAKTVMICCISPSSSSFDESLNALKYANRARNIRNKPIVNRDPQSIRFEEMQSEIKALREELQRQRTSLIPGSAVHTNFTKALEDSGQIKNLEDSIIRLQTECSHYRMIAEEAYKQLMDVQSRDLLSQSQNIRLSDWMELMEEIKNKVPLTLNNDAWENQTISRLETELKQCRNDLKSDEEIFAEKTKELSSLQDRIAEVDNVNAEYHQQLEEMEERLKQQQEQLVDKQMSMEELQAKLSEAEQQQLITIDTDSSLEPLSGPPTTSRRAKSVPAHFLGDRSMKKEELTRNIHTSPALFSLERVMQGFRARSQLLVSRLEDNDDVLQPHFSEDEVNDNGDDEADGEMVGRTNGGTQKEKSPFDRNSKSRGTYRVKRPKVHKNILGGGEQNSSNVDILRKSQTDDEKLMEIIPSGPGRSKIKRNKTFSKNELTKLMSNTETQKKKLKQTELEVRQSTQKMRDLNINIRMKEQLIKELVKTGKDAQSMNKQYQDKILHLEKEKQEARSDLHSLTSALNDLETRGQHDKSEKERLQLEFRKKMELAKTRIHALQKKQKETEKMANITGQTDKRIQELEVGIEKMRQLQDQLQRRLKEEMERKSKMEREMQKEQQRIKELEVRNEQQQKVLKVKTEEMSAMHRRLRNNSSSTTISSDEQTRQEDQKRWLDQEIEKVLEQRQQIEGLQKELELREDVLSKKEALLAEKSELEIKKLRSSQVLNKDIVLVSNKLDMMDRKIEEKSQEIVLTPREGHARSREELQKLQHGRDRLNKQRDALDGKLHEGTILTPQEERRLIELDEAVDALDAAIEYRNEVISSKKEQIRKSTINISQGDEHFMSKIKTLSPGETKSLLARYFEKVIDLRDTERKRDLFCSELEMKVDEQERLISELESSLQRSGLEKDRRVTAQQQEYERKIQTLMQQLTELDRVKSSGSARGDNSGSARLDGVNEELKSKVQQLEKDLFYYKKTSRELKKKLREILAENLSARGAGIDTDRSDAGDAGPMSPKDQPGKVATPRPQDNHKSSGQQSSRNGDLASARSAGGDNLDKVGHVRDGGAPVRISRKDLRRMSQEEVQLRKSAADTKRGDTPRDSLETNQNPWT